MVNLNLARPYMNSSTKQSITDCCIRLIHNGRFAIVKAALQIYEYPE